VINFKYHPKNITAMKQTIRNWSDYNAGLRQRGSLTFWVEDTVLEGWYNATATGKRGASNEYSNLAIMTFVTLKSVYHQAERQTQGFIESLFKLMGIELSVPEHSTVSRRMGKLQITLPVVPKTGARHIVVDSTGVKVYGEGEWKTRQHGVSKRRTRKNAKIWQHGNSKAPPHPRDENLRQIRQHGRKQWKRDANYHRRSLAETTMFRLKVIFGGQLRSRTFDNQAIELFVQCAALNRMMSMIRKSGHNLRIVEKRKCVHESQATAIIYG
jgi:hypothetical protein